MKTEIRKFYWREENGFSTRNCLTEIDLSYDEIKTELEELVESFEDQIGQAGETDWEEELPEIVEYFIGLKSKNLHIFRKIIQNSEKSRNHKKSRTTPKTATRDLDKSDAHFSEVQQGTKQVGNWQVRLEKSEKEEMVSSGESKEMVNKKSRNFSGNKPNSIRITT